MGAELCACKFTYSSLSFGSALKPFKRNRKAVSFAGGDVGKVWGFVSVEIMLYVYVSIELKREKRLDLVCELNFCSSSF